MHSCLFTDPILHRIISKLDLSVKFGVQGVCRHWKNIAIQCLRRHEYLVISERPPSSFPCFSSCHEHLFKQTDNTDNLIWGKQIDLEFWERTLSFLQGVKYVYLDIITFDERGNIIRNNKPILQLLIDSYGQSLECLCIPDYDDKDDETFPLTDSLPRLKHIILTDTTSQVTKNILSACPNLEYLQTDTSFTEWQMLPKRLKILQNEWKHLNGMNNLLCSPAVQSLEVVRNFVMTNEIHSQSYHLSSLKQFYVTIDFDVTNCLTHLARILSFAPVLCELRIDITASAEIQSQAWIKVLSNCETLTNLNVSLVGRYGFGQPVINVSSWQDDFAKTVVSNIKKLEHLDIDFHLSSDGLRLLSQLENLECFRHEVHTEKMSYDSVFDTDALVYFLSEALSKKLTSYRIIIKCTSTAPGFNGMYGEYLILKESFLDFADKIEQQYFTRLEVYQDHRHSSSRRPPPEKIPGMIFVTGLSLSEWDLIRPEM